MLDGTPPSSYWERPDPSPDEAYEDATWQADQLVSEWADFGELELFISVSLQRGGEPLFELTDVQRDGILLEKPGLEVEDIAEIRAFLERNYPLNKEDDG